MRRTSTAFVLTALVVTLSLSRVAAATPASGSAPTDVQALSCPTLLTCTAVGGGPPQAGATSTQVFRTTDGGGTWSAQSAPNVTQGLAAVSCPTTSFCLAEGPDARNSGGWSDFLRTTDGGATWVPRYGWADPPVCAGVSRCYATDDGTVFRSTDTGQRWVPLSKRDWSGYSFISCLTRSTCYVIGSAPQNPRWQFGEIVGFAARVKPIALMPFSSAHGTPEALSCASQSHCVATMWSSGVGAFLFVTADGGHHWVTRSLPVSADPSGIDCVGPGVCVLLGDVSVLVTADGGARWTSRTFSPRPSHPVGAISCRVETCFVSTMDAVYVSSDDLQTWTGHLVS
jgi:photosystem II stability/assembly factor-like uncharacterized protein